MISKPPLKSPGTREDAKKAHILPQRTGHKTTKIPLPHWTFTTSRTGTRYPQRSRLKHTMHSETAEWMNFLQFHVQMLYLPSNPSLHLPPNSAEKVSLFFLSKDKPLTHHCSQANTILQESYLLVSFSLFLHQLCHLLAFPPSQRNMLRL